MTTFFGAWLGLALLATMVSPVWSLAVYRFIDATFMQFVILLVAPAVQAAVLAWPPGQSTRVASATRLAWHHRLGRPVMALDMVLLTAGIISWSSSMLGFGASTTIQPTWIAVKAIAAACLCVTAGRAGMVAIRIAMAGITLVVAAHAEFGVLERVFAEVDLRARIVPEVFLRLAWFGGSYIVAVATVIRVSRRLSDAAGTWVSTAVALSVPGVVLVACAMFTNPGVLAPWRGFALLSASASMTSLLLGVVLWSRSESPRP